MSTNNTLEMIKASNDLIAANKTAAEAKLAEERLRYEAALSSYVEKLSSVLPTVGLSSSILSEISASKVVTQTEYTHRDDGDVSSSYDYQAGSFTAKLSEYKNLSIVGEYNEDRVRGFEVIAKTKINLLFFKLPITRSFRYAHQIGGDCGEFIKKFGILA